MNRRDFLTQTGFLIGAGAIARPALGGATGEAMPPLNPADWESVRAQFVGLDPSVLHFSGFFLASHPHPVRDEIERHRKALDANPLAVWERAHNADEDFEDIVLAAAGRYLGVDAKREVALTDSTTMGLGLLYNGLRLRDDQEILSTTHDHYATNCSLDFRTARTGTMVRRVPLYEDGSGASVDGIVSAIIKGLMPKTRVVAVTWVHSCSGVKLPIRAIADALQDVNAKRDEADRVLLCVDGVHGLGVDDITLKDFGCDFFMAGTHKWMFGLRGTGIWWGKPEAWKQVQPMIPPFGDHDEPGALFTPGGFHSFEHRWALNAAFELHMTIGKPRIQQRIHALNRRIKAGLAPMSHVRLYTPMSESLSAGIVCFDVTGMSPGEVVHRLHAKRIMASESPYDPSCARLAGSLLVNETQVDEAIKAVAALA